MRSPIETPPSRHAGESLEQQVHEEHFQWWAYLAGGSSVAISIAIISWVMHWLGRPELHWPLTIAAAFLLGWTAFVIRRDMPQVRNMLFGARGERAVGDILDQIRRERGYHVLHDIPIYKGGRVGASRAQPGEQPVANIDHVLIGPAGVLVIETKARMKPDGRRAEVLFDGRRVLIDGRPPDRDPIAQARRNADDVRTLVHKAIGEPVPVRPVVMFPGWMVKGSSRGADVSVLNPKQLFNLLRTAEFVSSLSERHQAAIVELLA